MPAPVRVALLVNLLTEDNLPYYYASLSVDDRDSAWAQWTRQWTAEEGRHAIVIRDYLTVTRSIDPVALERGRMQQVAKGETPIFDTVEAGLVYTTLQELATRIAHRNTGELLDDPAGRAVMRRVAADENLHHLFYRDLATEMLVRDPSSMVVAIDEVVRTFAMPGTGIADFARHARTIASLGVYDFSIHYHQIVAPMVLQRWDVEALTGLDDDAERARDRLVRFVERLAKAAARADAKREAREARARPPAERAGSGLRLVAGDLDVATLVHEALLHEIELEGLATRRGVRVLLPDLLGELLHPLLTWIRHHDTAEGAVANVRTSSSQNAGRSSGFRLLTSRPSTCTRSSTQCAPAFSRSVFRLGHDVSVRPSTAPASTRIHGP